MGQENFTELTDEQAPRDGQSGTVDPLKAQTPPSCESLQQDLAWSDKPITTTIKWSEAPPCLQQLVVQGFPQGTRNPGLHNLAVYARKSDPDNWPRLVEEMNRKYMHPQLAMNEVNTIIESQKKKPYFYGCKKQPIAPFCNREICKSCKFGVGNGPRVHGDQLSLSFDQ